MLRFFWSGRLLPAVNPARGALHMPDNAPRTAGRAGAAPRSHGRTRGRTRTCLRRAATSASAMRATVCRLIWTSASSMSPCVLASARSSCSRTSLEPSAPCATDTAPNVVSHFSALVGEHALQVSSPDGVVHLNLPRVNEHPRSEGGRLFRSEQGRSGAAHAVARREDRLSAQAPGSHRKTSGGKDGAAKARLHTRCPRSRVRY